MPLSSTRSTCRANSSRISRWTSAGDKSLYDLFESRYGVRMIRAEERLRAVAAEGVAAELLQVDEGSPLLLVERVAFTYGDKPVEWRRGFLCHARLSLLQRTDLGRRGQAGQVDCAIIQNSDQQKAAAAAQTRGMTFMADIYQEKASKEPGPTHDQIAATRHSVDPAPNQWCRSVSSPACAAVAVPAEPRVSRTYAVAKAVTSNFLVKLILLGLIWLYMHHFCAGIRYLLLDLHVRGIELEAARFSSKVVFAVSITLTVIIGASGAAMINRIVVGAGYGLGTGLRSAPPRWSWRSHRHPAGRLGALSPSSFEAWRSIFSMASCSS